MLNFDANDNVGCQMAHKMSCLLYDDWHCAVAQGMVEWGYREEILTY